MRFTRERGVDWDMPEAELNHLADTLAHMSLLVCYASSLSVDAAVFDKPVINVNFEITPSAHMMKSPTQFYRMEHYRKALHSGGIRLVVSAEELLAWVKRYLADPTADRAERGRLVRDQAGALDGKAGERLGDALLAAAAGGKRLL